MWRDTSDIRGGSAWREAISQAINGSQAVVVLLSVQATDSESVARELSLADEMSKLILPVVVGECDVRLGRLAYTLSGLQLIDGLLRPMSDVVTDIEAALTGIPPPLPPPPPPPPPSPDHRTAGVILGGALGVLALALVVALWLARDDAPSPTTSQRPTQSTTEQTGSPTDQSVTMTQRNGSCSASTCDDSPIAFVIEPANVAVTSVQLTDPSGYPVESADPPTLTGSSELEWRWHASYADPIGEYEVVFVIDGKEHTQSFQVVASDEAFGVVQKLAATVANQDWEGAAGIDVRFAEDLAAGGERSPDQQYANWIDQHWIASDPGGRTTDQGTVIIGGFVAVNVETSETWIFCERWIVFPGNESMRSSAFPNHDDQYQTPIPRTPDISEVEAWIQSNCSEPTP